MAASRVCSECGAPLEGKSTQAKTCSVRCRQARARRRSKSGEAIEATEQLAAEVVTREATTEIEKVMAQELIPVVRQAIDDDVIRAIQKLVALTPDAIEALSDQLASDDEVLRQRAAQTVVKYTIGHQALVKSSDEKHEQLIVNFNLPRPDGEEVAPSEAIDADPATEEEVRVCDICQQEKPLSEFKDNSERCLSCFEEWRAKVIESLA